MCQCSSNHTLRSWASSSCGVSIRRRTNAGSWSSASVRMLRRCQNRRSSRPWRRIASVKSWLCHSGVDRTAAILPWHGTSDVERLSPVAVSSRYLAHIAAAWDTRFPEHPLQRQEVTLTVPASFDEVARRLTVAAAQQAGLQHLVLLEEPQAALYAWVYAHEDNWHTLVQPGLTILVCDIGGGTTDFTLIRVRAESSEHVAEDGKPQLQRIAVGCHVI